MAMPARAFVAKVGSNNIWTFLQQLDSIIGSNFAAVYGFIAAIPNRDDDAALRRTVDLYPKVSARKTARLIVGPDGICLYRDPL